MGEREAALWFGVVAIGLYHGLNPAMGWPLAVANGLSEKRGAAVFATLLPLGVGHLLAMAVVLAPFAALAWLLQWSREIRIGAGLLVLLFGAFKLVWRRHPRVLVRIAPSRLVLWSFLVATAHGAGLMLLPITIGLCQAPGAASFDGRAPADWIGADVTTALVVALVHTLAMVGAGVGIAWLVYRHLGLQFLRRSWFDLDVVWALSLMLAGAAAVAVAAR